MGFLTTTAKVWYPATTDKMQLHTLFSTMASSIENGLGVRMSKQELNKGALVGLTSSYALPSSGTFGTVPYTVGDSPLYNNGMTVSGGVVTVVTPGLYQLNANYFAYQTGGYLAGNLFVNGTLVSELLSGINSTGTGTNFSTGVLSASQVLKAGDTVSVKVASYNKTSDTPNAPTLFGAAGRMLNTLSVTLIKAT